MTLGAQPINVPYEADFDELVMNRDQAPCALVLDSLLIFRVLDVDTVNVADDFEVR